MHGSRRGSFSSRSAKAWPTVFLPVYIATFSSKYFYPSLSNKIPFSSLLFIQACNIKMYIAKTFSLPTFFERHDSSLGKSIQLFIQFAGKRVLRSQLFLFAVSTLKTVCACCDCNRLVCSFWSLCVPAGQEGSIVSRCWLKVG